MTQHNGTNCPLVQIQGSEIERITYRNDTVVTFAQIDKVHARPDGTAGRNFRENRERFVKDDDFILLDQPDEIRRLGFTRPQGGTPPNVILITRRGYLKVVKSLNDDVAWSVFEDMVDRYFAVEAQPVARLDDNAWLRHTLLGYTEKVTELEGLIAEAQPKLQALDRIADADGSFCPTDAAKTLQIRPKDVFKHMRGSARWLYSRAGGGEVAYQDKIQAGLMIHKTTIVLRPDGSEKAVTQARITPKGLTVLAQQLGLS